MWTTAFNARQRVPSLTKIDAVKTFFSTCCLLLACHVSQAQTVESTPIDAIVAVVGDGIVLESEVEAQAFAMRAQMAQMGQTAELTEVQRCNLLEELIFQKLLVHHAKLDSLEVTDAEVMDEIDRRLAYYVQMFGSVEAFEAEYGQSVSEWKAEFQDPVMEQLLAGRMQAQINQQVRATPAEVQQLFAETPADSLPLIPEAVRYRELVLQPAITEAQKGRRPQLPRFDPDPRFDRGPQHDLGRIPPLGRPRQQVQRRLLPEHQPRAIRPRV